MSDNEQKDENRETVADILEEMCGMGNYQRYSGDHAHALADRIETAWKRERAEVEADALAVGGIVEAARTAEKSSAVGNAAAMREALENAYSLLCEGIATEVDDELKHPFHLELACEKIQNALAEPPRNCDVGTAEEQGERQKAYCRKHFTPDKLGGNCRKCPLKDRRGWSCQLAWAQMPYAEEGGER